MRKIEVINEKCTACGLCVRTCPSDAIHVIDEFAVIDYGSCILCGACAEACPENAIRFEKPGSASEDDLAIHKDVWVFCEARHDKLEDVSLELLCEGRKLADKREAKLCGILIGENITQFADIVGEYGADRIFVVDSPVFKHFRDDTYADALIRLIEKYKPEIVLAGATVIGRSFMPRVAATLKTGLTADCTGLSIDEEGHLMQTRPAFGGNIMATILCKRKRPQMATVRPGVMKKKPNCIGNHAVIINESLPEAEISSLLEFIDTNIEFERGKNIMHADVVVAGGGGLKSAENFAMLDLLANSLGGAVAATRTAVDRGWIKYSRQVGQTGKTVAPRLYIAVGISGAIQHLVGMQTSGKILAINNDPNAPIFRVADWGLVGDLFEIVPKLTEILSK